MGHRLSKLSVLARFRPSGVEFRGLCDQIHPKLVDADGIYTWCYYASLSTTVETREHHRPWNLGPTSSLYCCGLELKLRCARDLLSMALEFEVMGLGAH